MSTWKERARMRFLLMLPSIALLGLGLGACGDAGKHTGPVPKSSYSTRAARGATTATASSTAPPGGYLRGDGDGDEPNHRDRDNYSTRHYGHAASAAQERAIAVLVKRYYAAGAAGDGAAACALIYSSLADSPSLGETAEAVFPPAPSVPPLHGQSCPRIMSLLFEEDHPRLAADLATVVVTRVRVKGSRGLVLLGFRATPERLIPVRRERGAWKTEALLDKELL
jgi:hypothetical protein